MHNDPLNLTDPTGERARDSDFCGGGGGSGVAVAVYRSGGCSSSPRIMPIGIGFCIDGFPFWCDDRDDGPGDGRDKPADPHPPTPVPVVPPPVNIWQGPNVFGCSLTYVGGDRVHKRTSFNRQQIGIKMEFSCPQNPGQMYLRVVISRRRGWVWTEEMGDPREQTLLASQGNTIRMMDYATRCVEGSEEEYWAVFFAEADDLQNRVASWYEGSSPPVRIRC